ncbi:uncharacterized protein V6R79_018146 [Siganus canaliculatus]
MVTEDHRRCYENKTKHQLTCLFYGSIYHHFTLRDNMSAKATEPIQQEDDPPSILLSPDARCISSILENGISRAKFAMTLPAILQLHSASGIHDEELCRLLQVHEKLADRLESLEDVKQGSEGGQGVEPKETKTPARNRLERDIEISVRNILRYVQTHPDAIHGVIEEHGIKLGENEERLIKQLEKYHGHVVKQLLNRPSEVPQQPPDEDQDYDQEGSEFRKLTTAIEELDSTISEAIKKINRLQEKKISSENMDPFGDQQMQSHIEKSTSNQSSLKLEIDRQTVQLNDFRLENRKAERKILRLNSKLEEEIELLRKNFEDEIETLQAKLELNLALYEKEKEELRELEQDFSALEVEGNLILERRQVAEKKRMEELKDLELKAKAAVIAQAWWRGYSVRKAMAKDVKSRKAKKGKGGSR